MPDAVRTRSQVQRLYLEQSWGRTVTRADWAHAQHTDNCPICDDADDGWKHLERRLEAAETARAILAAGILFLLQHQQGARATRLRAPLTAEQIERQLAALRLRAQRAWKNGRRA